MNLQTGKVRISKKLLCVILSIIIAFGTFLSMSAANFRLADWLGIKSMITAYADEPEIIFYQEDKLIGLARTDFDNTEQLYYKVKDNGEWKPYTYPFSIPAYEQVAVYAKLGENGTVYAQNFTNNKLSIGTYQEAQTDFTFENNGIAFEFTREYNSATECWRFSDTSELTQLASTLYRAKLIDGRELHFVQTDENMFINPQTNAKLVFDNTDYTIEIDDIFYEGNLNGWKYQTTAIKDQYGNELNFFAGQEYLQLQNQSGLSYRIGNTSSEEIEYPNGFGAPAIGRVDVDDPQQNKIRYTYAVSDDGNGTLHTTLSDVVDQAGVTLNHYAYTDGKMTRSDDKTIAYNADGRVSQITFDNGAYIQYTYNDAEMTYTQTASSGESVTVQYNDAFLPTSVTQNGVEITYTYDEQYRVNTEVCNNVQTSYTYDENGKLTEELNAFIEPSNNTEELENTYYIYDENGNITRTQTGNDYWYYLYNAQNAVTLQASLKEDYSGEIPSAYDSNLTCFENVTTYTYNTQGQVETESTAHTHIAYEYDAAGNVIKTTTTTTDDNNETHTTIETNTYDSLGNMLTSTVDNETTSYTYDEAGRLLLTNDNGDCTRTVYDNLGRVVQEIEPQDYDAACEGLPSTKAYSNADAGHRYEYNANNQLAKEINRRDITTKYTYYDTGEKKTETFDIYKYEYYKHGGTENIYVRGVDETQRRLYAHYVYDEFNRNTEIQYGNDQTVFYEYDSNGNLTAQKYKESANATKKTQFTFTYNEDGEKTSKYDYAMNQRTKYGENGKVSIYDVKNYGENNETETLYYEYYDTPEETDEETGEVTAPAKSVKKFGNQELEITHSESANTYSYNNNSLFTTETTEDEDGRTKTETIKKPNGDIIVKNEYTYDDDDQIASMTVTDADGTQNVYTYEYDEDGRIKRYVQDDIDNRYKYDEKGQLTKYDIIDKPYAMQIIDGTTYYNQLGSETNIYTYDSRGNIKQKDHYSEYIANEDELEDPSARQIMEKLNYDDGIWLDKITNNKIEWEYLDNGEQIQINTELTQDDQGNTSKFIGTYTFNWQNGRQLETITTGKKKNLRVQERFTYDENGIRTSSKRRSSHLSNYTVFASTIEPRVETRYTNEDGVMTSSTTKDGYGYSESIIILRDDNKQPIGAIYNGDVYYYIKNAQGDVTRVVDENGTELVNYSYDPWGEINYCKYNKHCDSGFKSENPIQYRGYERDVHNIFERFYLQSRYYYYPIGRFINADIPDMAKEHKEDINGMNLFAYCQNDPINYTDPTGYWVETLIDVASIGWSLYDMATAPSWLNFAFLVWDVGAAFIPFAPGSYTVKGGKVVARGGKAVIYVASKTDNLKDAKNLTLGSYKGLRKIFKGQKGIEVHHIIEKRFRNLFKPHHNDFLSVPLEKELHKKITKRWRKEIKYGINYTKKVTKSDMKKAIKNVYYDMPALKKQALDWLERNWKGAKK